MIPRSCKLLALRSEIVIVLELVLVLGLFIIDARHAVSPIRFFRCRQRLDTDTVELSERISPLISATSSGSGVRSVRSPSLRWSLQGSFGRGQGAMVGVAEREPTTISSNFLQSHHHILYLRSI